jgi:hypothetical protein
LNFCANIRARMLQDCRGVVRAHVLRGRLSRSVRLFIQPVITAKEKRSKAVHPDRPIKDTTLCKERTTRPTIREIL